MTQATTETNLRSQDEIVTRIQAIQTGASLDAIYQWQVLVTPLDFEHGAQFCRSDATAEEWGEPLTAEEVLKEAREYLDFAIGKIVGHRGISASRSVAKLTEWAWLLCRDDIVEAMKAAEYKNYGAPKVRAFAQAFGWWPESPDEALTRMADGQPCRPDCDEGCGR